MQSGNWNLNKFKLFNFYFETYGPTLLIQFPRRFSKFLFLKQVFIFLKIYAFPFKPLAFSLTELRFICNF